MLCVGQRLLPWYDRESVSGVRKQGSHHRRRQLPHRENKGQAGSYRRECQGEGEADQGDNLTLFDQFKDVNPLFEF